MGCFQVTNFLIYSKTSTLVLVLRVQSAIAMTTDKRQIDTHRSYTITGLIYQTKAERERERDGGIKGDHQICG